MRWKTWAFPTVYNRRSKALRQHFAVVEKQELVIRARVAENGENARCNRKIIKIHSVIRFELLRDPRVENSYTASTYSHWESVSIRGETTF